MKLTYYAYPWSFLISQLKQFAAEIFNRFGADRESHFSKYRLTLGTEYNFKKWGTLEAYYRIESEINESDPTLLNIIGLKYTYKIKN